MHISYKPLWHTLLERDMRKEDLRLAAGTTSKFQLNNHSTNRCYMEANTTMQQRFFVTVFSSG